MNNKAVAVNIKDYIIDLYKTIFFIITSKKFKIEIFLVSSFIFFFVKYILQYASEPGFISPQALLEAKFYTAVMHWGITGTINLTIRRKIFHNKAVNVFIIGITLFMFWQIFALMLNLTAIGARTNADREYLSILAFYCNLFFTARIMKAYHLEEHVIKHIVITHGTAILMMYITYFDGFAFLSSLANVLGNAGRYRFAFGMGHFNTAGGNAFHFLMAFAVYRELVLEAGHNKWNLTYLYSKILCIVVIIVLLSTGSRAAITGIIGFWITYFTLKYYNGIHVNARVLMIYSMIIAVVLLIIYVDWEQVYELSNRAVNYTSPLLARMTLYDWFVGLGPFGFFDSFYLTTIVSTGIIGGIFIFTAVFYLTFAYFKNVAHMTKVQMLVGSMIIASMYRALFETFLAGQGAGSFTVWSFALAYI
ncbi:MAG: hypothetical protein IJT21_01135 [Synergistaceae bacterium]|nr:hypothetical protein [Synergistaceae bacterium]